MLRPILDFCGVELYCEYVSSMLVGRSFWGYRLEGCQKLLGFCGQAVETLSIFREEIASTKLHSSLRFAESQAF